MAASAGVLITALVVNDHAGLPQNAIVFVPMVQIAAAVIVETVVGRARNGSHER